MSTTGALKPGIRTAKWNSAKMNVPFVFPAIACQMAALKMTCSHSFGLISLFAAPFFCWRGKLCAVKIDIDIELAQSILLGVKENPLSMANSVTLHIIFNSN